VWDGGEDQAVASGAEQGVLSVALATPLFQLRVAATRENQQGAGPQSQSDEVHLT
jgi:hypothetical protein